MILEKKSRRSLSGKKTTIAYYLKKVTTMLSTKTLSEQVWSQETKEQLSQFVLLAPSVIEDQAKGVVYFGCSASEVVSYLNTFAKLYRCSECFVSDIPEHLPEFDIEIAIYDMQIETDGTAFGLDYLAESQNLKHWGIDSDRYSHYTTGAFPL